MNLNDFPDQSNTQSGVSTSKAVAGTGAEFKERAAFNRRRGAMRRRVHQVNYLKIFFWMKHLKMTLLTFRFSLIG